MTAAAPTTERLSPLHGLASLILPGLGQWLAGARSRAVTIFFTTAILLGLSVWTIAQRARFPDFNLGLGVFLRLTLECAFLLVFLFAAWRVLTRFVVRDPVMQTLGGVGIGILYFILLIVLGGPLLSTAASPAQISQIHTGTALFSAGALAAIWLWQVVDAARLGGHTASVPVPSMAMLLLLSCLLIFALGYTITGIDLGKAISEFSDTSSISGRILWPWRAAFDYDQDVIEETQFIQSPCPAGAQGPASNEPQSDEPWISVTPTCGDLGVRSLTGEFTPGTQLTITGGNFTPGKTVRILWKNPIGNAFTPRGVGPTEIEVDQNGEFTTFLSIPDVVVPESTSLGDQIHTLVVREESPAVFSGRLSQEMELSLVAMLETIMIGLMATFFGILLAFPLSFLAAKNLMASIASPLEQIVGSLLGLVAGFYLAFQLTQMAAAAVGGLVAAPIPIFLMAILLFGAFGFAGLRLGAWLIAQIIKATGTASFWVAAGLLALVLALPGYWIGLLYSRGVRAIVMGAEQAAANETTFGYIGAAVAVALTVIYAYRTRAKRAIPIGMIIYTVTRTVLNVVRSIEPLIWAIIATVWVGLGPFAGTIALTLHTIASLAKLYSEAIESIDGGPLEAIEATGATRLQTVVYAVIPQILPPYISFTIYRWDINIRMSTIIGLVGGGGIGFLLIQWIRLYQYEAAGIAIWLITITVAALDYISSEIRERFV